MEKFELQHPKYGTFTGVITPEKVILNDKTADGIPVEIDFFKRNDRHLKYTALFKHTFKYDALRKTFADKFPELCKLKSENEYFYGYDFSGIWPEEETAEINVK